MQCFVFRRLALAPVEDENARLRRGTGPDHFLKFGQVPTPTGRRSKPDLSERPVWAWGAGIGDSRQGLAAVLATPAAGSSLGGQSLLLGLGSKETAVFELTQDAGVLYRGPEPVYQALRAFAIPGGHISHSVLLQYLLFGPPPGGALSGDAPFAGSSWLTHRFLVAHRNRLHHRAHTARNLTHRYGPSNLGSRPFIWTAGGLGRRAGVC